MLKPRNKTKAISSFFSSKKRKLMAALLFVFVFAFMEIGIPAAWAGAESERVQIPLESFGSEGLGAAYLTKHPPKPIGGMLRVSKSKTDATKYRVVLLVPTPDAPQGSKDAWSTLANALEESGFDVLMLEPRKKQVLAEKSLIEDIQSGVVYLRTQGSSKDAHVIIIAEGAAANAAASYAGATRQMALIVDSLVLMRPLKEIKKNSIEQTMSAIAGIPVLLTAPKGDKASAAVALAAKKACVTSCKSELIPDMKHGEHSIKVIVNFVQGTNG